jgi:hypothetical protein
MALNLNIQISNEKQKCLEYDLEDIEVWVNELIDGKVNNCKKRLVKEAFNVMRADKTVDSIPADDSQIIAEYTTRPDYKNRKQRKEAEEE